MERVETRNHSCQSSESILLRVGISSSITTSTTFTTISITTSTTTSTHLVMRSTPTSSVAITDSAAISRRFRLNLRICLIHSLIIYSEPAAVENVEDDEQGVGDIRGDGEVGGELLLELGVLLRAVHTGVTELVWRVSGCINHPSTLTLTPSPHPLSINSTTSTLTTLNIQ